MSVNVNKSLWRLQTPGGISVKVVSRDGYFTDEGAGASETYIIRTEDLEKFIVESFPPPFLSVGGVVYPRPRVLPGFFNTLLTKRVSWKALTEGRPVDPFATDTGAPASTYDENLEITIEYGTRPMNDSDPDPGDPRTFCEISSNTSASFITPQGRGADKWGNGDPVKEADVTVPLIESETEWTVRWPQIPYQFMSNTLISRMRSMIGKVNSGAMVLFHNAPAETILFIGFSMQQQFTWRSGHSGKSPVVVEMKFVEKNFVATTGTQVTHNHIYRPGFGYQRYKINGTLDVYAQANLNTLFVPV